MKYNCFNILFFFFMVATSLLAMEKEHAWQAGYYSKHSVVQQTSAEKMLNQWSGTWQADESVLDLGCGDGKMMPLFSACVPKGEVVGIDSSPEMITYAQDHYNKEKYPQAHFSCIDACTLSIHREYENKFDRVFCHATLHWIKNQESVIKGISHALKPGGRALVQVRGSSNMDIHTALLVTESALHWREYFPGKLYPWIFPTTEQALVDLMCLYGLTVLTRLADDTIIAWHANKNALAAFVKGWAPHTAHLPGVYNQDLFFNEVVDYYCKLCPDRVGADGSIQVVMPSIVIEVTK